LASTAYKLTFRPIGQARDYGGADGAMRVRALLKVALRRFGLRCVSVEAVTEAVMETAGEARKPRSGRRLQPQPLRAGAAAGAEVRS